MGGQNFNFLFFLHCRVRTKKLLDKKYFFFFNLGRFFFKLKTVFLGLNQSYTLLYSLYMLGIKLEFSNLIFENSSTDQQGLGLECPVTFWRMAKFASVNQFGYLFWPFLRLTSLEPKAERSSIEIFFNLAPDNISVIFIKWSLNSVSKGVGVICNGACGQLFSKLFLK